MRMYPQLQICVLISLGLLLSGVFFLTVLCFLAPFPFACPSLSPFPSLLIRPLFLPIVLALNTLAKCIAAITSFPCYLFLGTMPMPFFLWFVKVFLSSVPAQASYPLPKLFLFPLLSAMLSLIFLALKVHRAHKKRKLQLWWNNRGLSKIYPWLFGSSLQSYCQTIA